jgi:ATP-dependent Clp protease adaptor protein ClpS
MIHNSDTCTEELLLVEEKVEVNKNVVLYNDDVNSFDFVIECLIKICKHEPIQAEQCTYLVHYSGKCAVKSGPFTELKPIQKALGEKGLTASIE